MFDVPLCNRAALTLTASRMNICMFYCVDTNLRAQQISRHIISDNDIFFLSVVSQLPPSNVQTANFCCELATAIATRNYQTLYNYGCKAIYIYTTRLKGNKAKPVLH